MNHTDSMDTILGNEASVVHSRITGASKKSTTRIFLYLLLLAAFWAFTFLTLNF